MKPLKTHELPKTDSQKSPLVGPTSIAYLASSTFSLLGNSISAVALPLALLITTGDALATGTLALICMVPQVIMGIIGGAALDALNRRDVSIVSDLVSASSMLMLPIIDITLGLNFGWFVLLGVIGAVGDIPGMTARSALVPAVCEKDGIDMQRFVGLTQAAQSLVMVIGPALATFLVALSGPINAFFVTAATSALASVITLFIPRKVGVPTTQNSDKHPSITAALNTAKTDLNTLFHENSFLKSCVTFTVLMVAVLAGYQGLIFPVFFVESGISSSLGFVLAAISLGTLVGSSVYALIAQKISNRTWYVISLLGMLLGMGIISVLPPFYMLILAALTLGFASGPFSSLLGFRLLEEIPDYLRGSVMGVQNSLLLVAAPVSVFIASILTSAFGVRMASLVLAVFWLVFTIYALITKPMRTI